MIKVLEILHVIQDHREVHSRIQCAKFFRTFAVIDTEELGRVMLIHSGDDGEFMMSSEQVLREFEKEGCDCLLCCLPALQYAKRPEVCEKLHMLYPELNEEIFTNNRTNHVLRIGYGDWDEWCEQWR